MAGWAGGSPVLGGWAAGRVGGPAAGRVARPVAEWLWQGGSTSAAGRAADWGWPGDWLNGYLV